jgi:hypothetical protein
MPVDCDHSNGYDDVSDGILIRGHTDIRSCAVSDVAHRSRNRSKRTHSTTKTEHPVRTTGWISIRMSLSSVDVAFRTSGVSTNIPGWRDLDTTFDNAPTTIESISPVWRLFRPCHNPESSPTWVSTPLLSNSPCKSDTITDSTTTSSRI